MIGKAEVRDYHISVAIEEKILQFEISMDDLLLVAVPYPGDELSKEFRSVSFFEIPVCEDMVEQFSSGGVFQNDSNKLVGFDDVV